MSEYYRPKRSRNLYDPSLKDPFKLSRSKIDLFLECPRCFYLDRRLGVLRPPGFPFSLNSAVDHLLKKEFDAKRAEGKPHPLMERFAVNAVPFAHESMERWRDVFNGVRHHHEPTNFLVYGAIDDVWESPDGALHIVDYKATSKDGEVTLDAAWQDGYKRQVEVYQWLFRKNGFTVSPVAYFVYANGKRDRRAFDGVLEFDISIIPYSGSDAWVEKGLREAHALLVDERIPPKSGACDYCSYREAAGEVLLRQKQYAERKTKTQETVSAETLFS